MSKFLLTTLMLLFLHSATAQNKFQDIFSSNKRPLTENIRIEFQDSRNNKTFLPIAILKGQREGPVFTIVAGVHGFEYPPIIGVQELLKEINIDSFTGTLIILPIANTASFFRELLL